MDKSMKPEYNALLQTFMGYRDEAGRKELLDELHGNHSPTQEELFEAINRITKRYFSKPRTIKRIKPPIFTSSPSELSDEEYLAKVRDWARDPRNWEFVDVEGDKD
ncbi:MAG TPA: hypothetical protein VG733_13110 [Chthoniobacteraceae bacterium]|nr:hypothetical protein [Chthoniobacteraceae bacterium]